MFTHLLPRRLLTPSRTPCRIHHFSWQKRVKTTGKKRVLKNALKERTWLVHPYRQLPPGPDPRGNAHATDLAVAEAHRQLLPRPDGLRDRQRDAYRRLRQPHAVLYHICPLGELRRALCLHKAPGNPFARLQPQHVHAVVLLRSWTRGAIILPEVD